MVVIFLNLGIVLMCAFGLTLLAAFMNYCYWFDIVVFLWKESGLLMMIGCKLVVWWCVENYTDFL